MTAASAWSSFPHDPREPASARLRASDQDREVAQQILAEGYADGRLDRTEYDERSSAVTGARTLGDLPALVSDLVPERPPPTTGKAALVSAGPDDLRRMAQAHWEKERREAIFTFLGPSIICWVIWFVSGFGGGAFHANFPWPLFVMLGTGIHGLRVLTGKQEILAQEIERLEKKQAKALERRRADEDPGPT